VLAQVQPEDLLKFGMIPEFIGRLPVVATLHELNEDALIDVLTKPKNSLERQYKRLFEMDGVKLKFTKSALSAVAREALTRQSGARGLRAILEKVMTEIMFDLPARDDVTEVVITRECIAEGRQPLLVTERPRAKKEA
jgi:ATP-dependent Clp protease ATP-binding subunit ClpX